MRKWLAAAAILAAGATQGGAQGMASNGMVGRGGGGGASGSISGPFLPATAMTAPRWNPGSAVVSGSANDFVPSTYVTFEEAIAEGKAAAQTKTKSVVEAAAESRQAAQGATRILLTQDDGGKAVVVKQ